MPAWPTGPIEYGSFAWLRRETAVANGLPADPRLLDHVSRSRVDSVIESALRQFYHPNPSMFTIADATEAQRERLRRAPHQWSFLQKSTDLSMLEGVSKYELPADFSNFLDEPTTSRSGGRIGVASIAHIKQLLSSSPVSGHPKYVAIETGESDGTVRQASSLLFYPVPEVEEIVTVRYGVSPPSLSESRQFPLGGVEHAETILAICILVTIERGGGDTTLQQQRVADRMSASVLQDVHVAQASSEGVWPVDEPDDGLEVNQKYLCRLIGRDLGFSPNRHVWTHQQTSMVLECLRAGLRRVYNPPVLPGERYPHRWSFLQPIGTLATVAGESIYQLPHGFSSLVGSITYTDAESIATPLIRQTGEEALRHRLQNTDGLNGRPSLAAVRLSNAGSTPGSRSELILWPVPDREYLLEYRYVVNPAMISLEDGPGEVVGVSDGASQPEGGQAHAQTFIESCLLACDELMKRDPTLRTESFYRSLQASIGHDRQFSSPMTLGESVDRGMNRGNFGYRPYRDHLVTYTPRR